MLRRLLAGLSIASLLVGAAILILWWRSYSHVDHFTLGKLENNQTEFTTQSGNVMVSNSRFADGMISSQSTIYQHK